MVEPDFSVSQKVDLLFLYVMFQCPASVRPELCADVGAVPTVPMSSHAHTITTILQSGENALRLRQPVQNTQGLVASMSCYDVYEI